MALVPIQVLLYKLSTVHDKLDSVRVWTGKLALVLRRSSSGDHSIEK